MQTKEDSAEGCTEVGSLHGYVDSEVKSGLERKRMDICVAKCERRNSVVRGLRRAIWSRLYIFRICISIVSEANMAMLGKVCLAVNRIASFSYLI